MATSYSDLALGGFCPFRGFEKSGQLHAEVHAEVVLVQEDTGCGGNDLGAMGRRLIHGLSGAAVFLVSVTLFSVRHRGAQDTTRYPGLREGISEKPEQRSKVSPEGDGGREQKDLQVRPPVGYRTEERLTLGDIFIAVKTTKRFHQSRMELLLDTWISQAREQVSVWIRTREGGFSNGVSVVVGDKGQRKGRLGTAIPPRTLPRFP